MRFVRIQGHSDTRRRDSQDMKTDPEPAKKKKTLRIRTIESLEIISNSLYKFIFGVIRPELRIEHNLGLLSNCCHFPDFGDASVFGHLLQSFMKQLAQCCRVCRQDASQV